MVVQAPSLVPEGLLLGALVFASCDFPDQGILEVSTQDIQGPA